MTQQVNKGGRPAYKGYDWNGIEQDFRQGVMSANAIARKYGVKQASQILKKARRLGWRRELLDKIKERAAAKLRAQAVRLALVPIDGAPVNDEPQKTDEQLIEEGARAITSLVREHRGDIRTARDQVNRMLDQLRQVAGDRDAFLEIFEHAGRTELGVSPERKVALMRACTLPQNIAAMRDLSMAMKTLIQLERQAFGLSEDERAPATSLTDQRQSYPSLESFAEKMGRLIPPEKVA